MKHANSQEIVAKHKTIRLQEILAGSVLITVSITAAIVHFPWMFTSRKNVLNVVNQLNQEIVRSSTQEVSNLFNSTLTTQRSIHRLLERQTIDVNNLEELTDFYLTLLQANPHVSWLSFGYKNGDFFGVQREKNSEIRVIDSRWDETKKLATRKIKNYRILGKNPQQVSSKIEQQLYYSPMRSWYIKAIKYPGEDIWTDVYIFNTSGKPGINSAITLDQAGKLVGVVSIAIELERISLYLKTLHVGKTGVAFIVNARQELIGFPMQDEITYKITEGREIKLQRLGESKHPLLRTAYQALQNQKISLGTLKSLQEFSYQDPVSKERYFVSFAPLDKLDWIIGTIIPESDFVAEIEQNQRLLLYAICALIFTTAGLAIFLAGKVIATPLLQIAAQAKNIQSFQLQGLRESRSRIREIDQLSIAIDQMSVGLASFQRYLPTELVRTLIQEGIVARLGGEQRVITIFFIDIVAFTQAFEKMGNEMIAYVGEFYELMSRTITDQDGTIDKYIGDCIMAFWGAPIANDRHAIQACRAALKCQQVLASLRPRWQAEAKPPLHARIGINTGMVLVGNIGFEEKMDYTAMGDPVNVASRLESLNKTYGTDIIIGAQTYALAKEHIIARELDTVAVYGKQQSLVIYELLAMRAEVNPETFRWLATFEAGLIAYKQSQWERARELFAEVIQARGGNDEPSVIYRQRCEQYLLVPPDTLWQPITVLDSK